MNDYQFILTYNGTSTTLDISPAGWDEIGVEMYRHKTYHTILRDFTLPLRFVDKQRKFNWSTFSFETFETGYDVINTAYETDGIYAQVGITINKLNSNTNNYEAFYSGDLDFNTEQFNYDETHRFIEVSIIDGLKLHRLISRDELELDVFNNKSVDNVIIDSFPDEDKSITLTPIDILLSAVFNASFNDFITGILDTDPAYIIYGQGINFSYTDLEDRVPTGDAEEYIYKNTTSQTVEVEITLTLDIFTFTSITNTGVTTGYGYVSFYYYMRVYDDMDVHDSALTPINNGKIGTVRHSNILINGTYDQTKRDSFNYKATIQLPPDYSVKMLNILGADRTGGVGTVEADVSTGDTMDITIVEKTIGYTETTAKIIWPHEAFTRLIQLVTSETDTNKLLYSEFLGKTDSYFQTYSADGDGSKDAVTNIKLVRNYPNEPLNLSIKKLFHFFDSCYSLGLGYDRVNDRITIEEKTQYYDASYLMFDFGEVANFKRYPAIDKYYSEIKTGFNFDGNHESLQGALDYNNKASWTTTAPTKNVLNLQSDYLADSIEIELARRRQYSIYASTDTRYDNNVVVVNTDGTSPNLNTTAYGFGGVENYYNIKFSPREKLLRWKRILKAVLYKSIKPIKFVSSSKNVDMTYINRDGNTVSENSDINYSELTTSALFIPEYLEFEAAITTAQLQILYDNPRGFARCTTNEVRYEGFIESFKLREYNNIAEVKLIRKETTAFDNFVFVNGDNFVFNNGNNFVFNS